MLSNLMSTSQLLSQPRQAFLYDIDKIFLVCVLALTSLGLVLMTSASIDMADIKLDNPIFYTTKQLVFIAVALIACLITYLVPTEVWRSYSWVLLMLAFVLLALVLVPGIGKSVNGSQRWIPLGLINLQASEVVKFCLLVYISDYLVRRHDEIRHSWKGFFKPLLVLFFLIVLLLAEPDFGAVVVLGTAVMGMIFLAGVKTLQFSALIITGISAVVLMVVSSDYRMRRMDCFLDPWLYPFDCGYQLTQALIAFGRGEWFGVGLGNSVQKLAFLPEAHTDFIFAILAEELGIVGAIMTIIVFAVLIYRIILLARIAEKVGKFFCAYVCYGIAFIISIQVFINVGMNAGLLPTKGLTLPYVSYGGSSLIVCFVFAGFILRVSGEINALPASRKKQKQRGRKYA